MSGLRRLPGDEPTSRISKFRNAMRAIKETHKMVEELEGVSFGYQLREVGAVKVSIRQAEERLAAVASLGSEAVS